MKFGIAAPLFASPGIPTMRTPSIDRVSWPIVRDAVVSAERLGYESAWFSDHLFHGRDGEFYESWTALCLIAAVTDRIQLVNNHLGVGLRDARVVGKMATSLASATGGRLDLFLARGYRQREYSAYGLPWEPDALRTRRLQEAVDVIRALWPARSIDFEGEFYRLHGALASPTEGTEPFVWLGGPLDSETLAMIASRADGWNSFPLSPPMYALAAGAVNAACAAVGRNPETLRRSLETQVLVIDDWSEWQDWLEHWRGLRAQFPLGDSTTDIAPSDEDLTDERVTAVCRENFIVGTRDEVAVRISEYRSLGVTDLVCWFMDAPAETSMRAVAEIRDEM